MSRIQECKTKLLFPTPVFTGVVKDVRGLNHELRDLILHLKDHSGDDVHRQSNVAGWQSQRDFLARQDPPIERLNPILNEAVHTFMRSITDAGESLEVGLTESWANVLYSGAYNTPHEHGDSMLSGVYYVDVGESLAGDTRSGQFSFIDRGRITSQLGPLALKLSHSYAPMEPADGLILLFPGQLMHYVHPYQGDTPRIAIAFNMNLRKPG